MSAPSPIDEGLYNWALSKFGEELAPRVFLAIKEKQIKDRPKGQPFFKDPKLNIITIDHKGQQNFFKL